MEDPSLPGGGEDCRLELEVRAEVATWISTTVRF